MGSRRQSRELAMQALFYMDTNGDISLENLELYCSNFQPDANARPFFMKLAKGVINARSRIDAAIERFSSNWKMPSDSRWSRPWPSKPGRQVWV